MGRNNESNSINYMKLVLDYLYAYYENDKVDYLLSIVHIYPVTIEEGMDFYSCFENSWSKGKLDKILLIVPMPYDLKSSQIFIHEFKHGLDLLPYLNKEIGNLIDDQIDKFERRARTEEKSFKTYLVKKLSNKKH